MVEVASMQRPRGDGIGSSSLPVAEDRRHDLEAVPDAVDAIDQLRRGHARFRLARNAHHDLRLDARLGEMRKLARRRSAGWNLRDGRIVHLSPDRMQYAVSLLDRAVGVADLPTKRPRATGDACRRKRRRYAISVSQLERRVG